MFRSYLYIAAFMLTLTCRGENWTPKDVIALFESMDAQQEVVPPPPAGPIIMWTGLGVEPQTIEDIKLLNRHGFNQHLPLLGDHWKAADALLASGAPIQIMQGLKAFPLDDGSGKATPTPASQADGFNLKSWQRIASFIREQLTQYQQRSIHVDALWLDYEGPPFLATRQEVTSQAEEYNLPVQLNNEAWDQWRRQFTLNVLSSYIAGPAREIFPKASVLNWTANISYPESRLTNALGQATPVSGPFLFTHSNPYAYGNTLSYEIAGLPVDLPPHEVDEFYRHLILRHVSIDAYNRAASAPNLGSIPWVARIVKESQRADIPEMSREAYREALRHLWLRGIQGMMVFNAPNLSHQEHIAEISDVAAVWREMSQHLSLLNQGEAANFEVSGHDTYYWSAIRYQSRAVVRITPLKDNAPASITIPVWDDQTVAIKLPQHPQTYIVWRNESLPGGYLLTLAQ